MVVKPAPDTPWNATRLGRLIAEQHRHPRRRGQRRHVVGPPGRRGAHARPAGRPDLVHRLDRSTGKRIMEKGAATLKRVFLELGGKSADDRPRRRRPGPTVRAGRRMASAIHAGQGCAMQTRDAAAPVALRRGRRDPDRRSMETIPYGDPTDPATMQGPQVSAKQRDRVRRLHREGHRRGRRAGRRRRPAGPPRQGLLRRAHALRRRRQLHDHRAGGDLRAGARGDPVRRRRGRDPHRQRQQLRAVRRSLLGLAPSGPWPSRTASAPGRSR